MNRLFPRDNSEVSAGPKREMALCRHMRATRSSGLEVLVSWAVPIVDTSDSEDPQT